MFYFFVDPVCHAKSALRNSELTDKETSRKHQNIIGNIYGFYLYFTFLYIWNKVWLQRSCYNFSTTKSTSLEALHLCQTRSVHLLFTSTVHGGRKVKGLDYLVSKEVPSWLGPTDVENFLKLGPLDWLKLTFIKQEFVEIKERICNVTKIWYCQKSPMLK